MEAKRPGWLPCTGVGNWKAPPDLWALSISQLSSFIAACVICPEWEELVESDNSGLRRDCVNLYQVNKAFIIPWTRGTGNSISLLMNIEKPLRAELMISHAWAEDILAALMAILGKATSMSIDFDTPVWFCALSQYQPSDGFGPSVAEQLSMDPFKCVIESKPKHGMIVVHTAESELYTRLWCVYEINTALSCGVSTTAAVSFSYAAKTMERLRKAEEHQDADSSPLRLAFSVDTEKAVCKTAADSEMIRARISAAGGYKSLNETIYGFRIKATHHVLATYPAISALAKPLGLSRLELDQQVRRMLVHAVSFLGFQFLYHLSTQARDDATSSTIQQKAKKALATLHRLAKDMHASNLGSGSDSMIPEHPGDAWISECLGKRDAIPLVFDILHMFMPMQKRVHDLRALSPRSDRLAGARALFRQLDQDGNGKIAADHMLSLLKFLLPHASLEDLFLAFEAIDVNDDGELSYDEFLNWVQQPLY